MLPPSQRCRDQTDKDPTGPYKREKLLNYLEEQAKGEKDWEDVVPYSPGTKRGWDCSLPFGGLAFRKDLGGEEHGRRQGRAGLGAD